MGEPAKTKENTTDTIVNDQWRRNQEFFWQHAEEFKKKYPDKYVAVHDGEVLDVGDDLGDLVIDLNSKFGDIPIYADKPDADREYEMIHWPIIL